MKIMEKALAEGQSTLSEYESKQTLSFLWDTDYKCGQDRPRK